MPALSDSHAAAIRACVALLEAFDPERTAAECRNLIQIAIESAMDATGVPRDSRPKVDEILECFDVRAAEPA